MVAWLFLPRRGKISITRRAPFSLKRIASCLKKINSRAFDRCRVTRPRGCDYLRHRVEKCARCVREHQSRRAPARFTRICPAFLARKNRIKSLNLRMTFPAIARRWKRLPTYRIVRREFCGTARFKFIRGTTRSFTPGKFNVAPTIAPRSFRKCDVSVRESEKSIDVIVDEPKLTRKFRTTKLNFCKFFWLLVSFDILLRIF